MVASIVCILQWKWKWREQREQKKLSTQTLIWKIFFLKEDDGSFYDVDETYIGVEFMVLVEMKNGITKGKIKKKKEKEKEKKDSLDSSSGCFWWILFLFI